MNFLPQAASHKLFTSILHLCYSCHQFKGCVFDQRINLVMSLSSLGNKFYNLALHRLLSRLHRHGSFSLSLPGIGWLDASQLQTYL